MGGKVSYTSIKKYEDKAYDKMPLRVKKGNRAIIKTAAKAAGETARVAQGKRAGEEAARDD